jgi:hypothetical protein
MPQQTVHKTCHKQSIDSVQTMEMQSDGASKKAKAVVSSTTPHLSASAINTESASHFPLSDLVGGRRVYIPCSTAANDQLPDCSHTPPRPIINSSDVPNDDYPSIGDVVEELHKLYPNLDFPQYGLALAQHGIVNVNDIRYADDDLFIAIGMPPHILKMIRYRAMIKALLAEGCCISAPRY